MGPLLTIVGKDLRQRVRDRSVLIFGVLSPLALATIFSIVLPSGDGGGISLGIVTGGDAFAEQVAAGLEDGDGVEVSRYESRAAADGAVARDEVGAAVVVPEGLVSAAASGEDVTFEVLSPPDGGLSTLVAQGVADSVASRFRTARLAAGLALDRGMTGEDVETAATAAALADPVVALQDTAAADARLDAASYLSAAMAVFFVFFVVQFGLASLLEERQQGTLQRLLAAPIRPTTVVWAKVVTSLVVGFGSMTVLLVASRFLLGARFGDPVAVAVLTLAAVLAAVGIMAVVAAFARTAEQANGAQSIIGIVLGMLGGAFFPIGDEGLIGLAARLSPHRWFLRGLGELAGGGGVGDVAAHVGVLVAFFAVGLAAGAAVLAARPLEVR